LQQTNITPSSAKRLVCKALIVAAIIGTPACVSLHNYIPAGDNFTAVDNDTMSNKQLLTLQSSEKQKIK